MSKTIYQVLIVSEAGRLRDSLRVLLKSCYPLAAIAETETRYYTGLQVTNDPGVWVVYTGFLLMIAGCIVTFFMSHQQICIEAQIDGKIRSVMIRGIANKNKIDIQRKIDAIAAEVAQTENHSKQSSLS